MPPSEAELKKLKIDGPGGLKELAKKHNLPCNKRKPILIEMIANPARQHPT